MVRPALLPIALVGIVLLAGCSSVLPGVGPSATPADIDARIVDHTSTGGECVKNPNKGFVIESSDSDGVRTISVEANVTVPGAQYVVNAMSVTKTDTNRYRFDVNTTESSEKPEQTCSDGGIVHYEATIEVPATEGFELQIRHDGEPVSGVGSGGET